MKDDVNKFNLLRCYNSKDINKSYDLFRSKFTTFVFYF